MSEGRAESEKVRLFVALDLPRPVCEGIAAWGRRELAEPALRPVATDSLHITLAFLGWRPRAQLEQLGAIVAASAAPAPLVELLDPVPRPPRGRARLYALPARSPGAEAIEAELRGRLVEAGLYEPEGRPYWPHVTVARVRPVGRGSRRPMGVESPPAALPDGLAEPFYGIRIVLYRSQSQPGGARYAPLAQVELPGAGGSEVI